MRAFYRGIGPDGINLKKATKGPKWPYYGGKSVDYESYRKEKGGDRRLFTCGLLGAGYLSNELVADFRNCMAEVSGKDEDNFVNYNLSFILLADL
jgi:hypothetical protein